MGRETCREYRYVRRKGRGYGEANSAELKALASLLKVAELHSTSSTICICTVHPKAFAESGIKARPIESAVYLQSSILVEISEIVVRQIFAIQNNTVICRKVWEDIRLCIKGKVA